MHHQEKYVEAKAPRPKKAAPGRAQSWKGWNQPL